MFSRSLAISRTLPSSSTPTLRVVARSQRFASSTGSGEPISPSPKNSPNSNIPIIAASVLGVVAAVLLMRRDDGGVSQPKSALANAVTDAAPDAKNPVVAGK